MKRMFDRCKEFMGTQLKDCSAPSQRLVPDNRKESSFLPSSHDGFALSQMPFLFIADA